MNTEEKPDSPLKQYLRSVIFGTETLAGKRFDIALMVCIVLSVLLIFIDTIERVNSPYGDYIQIAEWTFTVIFTVEYILRIYCSLNRLHYARSFFGVVDLVSILPSYLDLIFPGANVALALRVLRLFRVFRVLKLLRYLRDGHILLKAMMQSSRKVFMFFFAVSLIIMVLSVIMYVVEGPNNGFTSIPQSMYWTVVTITTVGYGDITPQTPLGQAIAALTMLIGYSIIAIPTGILTAEITHEMVRTRDLRKCSNCGKKGHDNDAEYCNHCGSELEKL
ncbi:MAG: ion transporter [Shewanella psychromarinicola]|jgi:voltage-gated potassium channel|uniref:Ion transporter n=1 Tax=Shewanella psychromarinicola TaxID=2487742 RepID=A0A3N4EC78_9GAMM|nr:MULTISPECIES: ion transporter [Shewanella]AZG36661.1 ion transporter [Shewanella psychromarinicola]MCL1082330.1 ion transporter [Shewanella psychromarinicola]PKG77893.1 ion transporter [Shewanella sp. Actino-trap-3]RPA34512.1 ion transporter [Shewanella psychromarinicola]|tara:strand:+ start:43071 stop:43901 length:831 start_codon:yes stop_codon:yes gene_type:complete